MIFHRIKNFFEYIPTIPKRFIYSSKWFFRTWNSPNWDYAYLLYIIGYKISDMNKTLQKADFDKDNDCPFQTDPMLPIAYERLQICDKILKRIADDKYDYNFPSNPKKYIKNGMFQFPEDRDAALALKILSKYFNYWWN